MHADTQKKTYSPVSPDINLSKEEEKILDFWERHKIFERSLQQTCNGQPFIFYDGPPFATGLPHYGHIMAGVLKDIVPRYWTMRGRFVPRKFGWDCHGLPVEHEINKTFNLESRKDILAWGISNYNEACRAIVKRYSTEWEKTVNRVGRWVDMENAYYTMDTSFMQSVWWVFQELWKKGLIYEGYKVVPYSVGISTPLSNFEANLNYKQVQDPAVTVSFPIKTMENVSLLAWTTTPWTLPSNLALAIGKEIDYIKVVEQKSGNGYIFARSRLESLYKTPEQDLQSIEPIKSEVLLGLEYEPPFSYFVNQAKAGAFKVIYSDHVTTDAGTGVVHIAPAFGEDDYYACIRSGIPLVNPVDEDGMFTSEIPNYSGRRVKETEKDLISDLKKSGKLFRQETIEHSYPFCWRTDTPLIYKAVSSWFVAVEKIKDQIIANNLETRWVPDHLRDGRFGKWLENARDWAISRNRFWGTPLPIWKNSEGETICIGSKKELESLSGCKIEDLHIDFIDQILIPSPTGKSPLKRVDGVLDCWFESGSMPYAQLGLPDTSMEEFNKYFPADFIAEGLDQTRGWFYTLMVIGSALFNKPPFKNVIVNGLILAEDGKKMSKSLKNYPDPLDMLNAHGADALRLYLIDSPVVRAQELKFSEVGVKDIVRRILLRWWNSYSFFVNYANIDQFKPNGDSEKSTNILDEWVISRLNSLIDSTNREMESYRLYNVVPGLLQFIEDLTNTYIRFNRRHFWQDGMPEDKRFAFETLYHTLFTLSKIMAPFAPFLAEITYSNLSKVQENKCESVHLEKFPVANLSLIRPDLEKAIHSMEALVLLGRNYREKILVKAKIPLLSMTIIHRDSNVLESLKRFEAYFQGELNIREIKYSSNEDQFLQVSAKANFPVLGPRLGSKMKAISRGIGLLQLQDILKLESNESISVEGESITLSDVEIRRSPRGENPNLSIHQLISVEIDPSLSEEQIQEGLAREVIRKIQASRKGADFYLDDRISVEMKCEASMQEILKSYVEMIKNETLCTQFIFSENPTGDYTETVEIEDKTITLGLAVVKKGQI